MTTRTRYVAVLFSLMVLLTTGTVTLGSTADASPSSAQKALSLGGDILLPGDTAIGPAAGNQDRAQIAAGGDGYLVVWEESRANHLNILGNQGCQGGDPCGQTLKDIYAARLDANGQLVDTIPIVVSQATWDQSLPQVAWNGQNWLVVWNTQRVANFSYTTDVVAARISPQGVLLDPQPIVVDNNPTIDELYPSVASDGTNWVIVWFDQGDYFELDAARISPEGVHLDPGGVPIYQPQFPQAPYNFSIAFAGDEFLIALQQWGPSDDNIAAIRITPTLQRIGGVTNISTASGNQIFPDVASNGTDFFVVWHDQRFSQSHVYGSRVNHQGQALDPLGIDISGGATGGYPYPEVTWAGTHWITTWSNYSTASYASRISTAGAVLDFGGVVIAPNSSLPALAGKPEGGAQVVFTDLRGGGASPYDIYTASFSAAGTAGPNTPVSLGAPSQRQPDLAPNGSGYLAVFLSEVSGETRIKAQRLNADGTAIDSEPILVQGGFRTLRAPRVAWNGTLYLVIWEDYTSPRGFVTGSTFGKRVAADGTVLDATPFEIVPGNFPDVAALGSNFLVVSTHEATNHLRYPKSVVVTGGGVVQGSPVVIGSNFSLYPKVTALGNRWLVTYQRHPTHDNPASSINANFVTSDGNPVGEFNVAPSTSRRPNVATGANQGIIAYYRSGDIYARRIQPDGTFLDTSPGIQVTSAPNDQFLPAVAWNGSEYVIAYEDYRHVIYLDKPVSDIYGTRVDANGLVMDPSGFVIANDFIPEMQPVVEALNGSYLIGYADFKYQAPYAAYRINVRSGQAGGLPTPEPTRTATSTASPTPPVCIPDNYSVSTSTGASIVPGTTDTGNHCDTCATLINLPFSYQLYDQTYSTVEVTADGTMNFVYSGNTGGTNFCLPYSGLGYSIIPHWDDMMTSGTGNGIFTSVSGTAPNRIFNIEWRTCSWEGGSSCGSRTYNFEVRLYEGQQRFDFIYGQISDNGQGVTVGVQKDTGQRYTQYECNTGGLSQGLQLTFMMQVCPTATPGSPTNIPGSATPTNTRIPTNTAVSTAIGTATIVATSTAMGTAVATSSSVPASATVTGQAATSTPAQTTGTAVSATSTVVATSTNAAIATSTAIACALTFSDVPEGHTFYPFVKCLACQGILGGYTDGTFRPNNDITRGQISKIVSQSAGFSEPAGTRIYEDVPEASPFFTWIQRLSNRGLVGGYQCGLVPDEPCVGPTNRPYFRPSASATRGQLSKIVASAKGVTGTPTGQRYADVGTTHTFYVWIEQLSSLGAMGGYACGSMPTEPCDGQNRPYFRPSNNVTRGQASKIVANTFFPACQVRE
ncbi:MAG TPA: S-layer homology domain-containing protein [Chloroflexia bacterium]|nr:S-layer homology domain-containing protein [Chloroflexia bacterium]